MDAGPAEETPGAQELGREYEFHYGFLVHSPEDSLHVSAEQADVFSSQPQVFSLDHSEMQPTLYQPLIQLDNPSVRISSMRMRGNMTLLTLYNIEDEQIETGIKLAGHIKRASEVMIDGTVLNELPISSQEVELIFSSREIKICIFE